jgi:hypothetical protein
MISTQPFPASAQCRSDSALLRLEMLEKLEAFGR